MISAFVKSYWKQIASAAVAVVVVVCIIIAWNMHGDARYSAGQDAANQSWQIKWSERDKSDALAQAFRNDVEREKEHNRQAAADEEQTNGEKALAKAQADADNAQRAADGLQQQLAYLQHQLGRSETSRLSATAALGQARGEAAVLLAQLLSKSDKAAGEYAAAADRAYESGKTCERTYDAVTSERGISHGTVSR
ncbi:DUF2514 family protein [Raoultella sp. HC6]|uniref:DUF2514 family protein n=1 Tax=Raoultella sp. HC6 TaxID=2923366 RepID=UPI001F513024|nr:DUF2514 family protein [Raoultella sp. HC6]